MDLHKMKNSILKGKVPMEESKQLLQNSDDLTTGGELDRKPLLSPPLELKVYCARWLMLALFSLTTLLNGSMFMGLSSVVEVVAPYYEVSAVHIEWLSNMFMVVYIFVSLPSAFIMSKYGVRTILTVASGFGAAAASLQYAGSKRESFQFVVIGQFFAALAYGNIMQVPGKLSALWFPPHERGLATSIGVFMNILGVAIGFIMPANLIPATEDHTRVLGGLKLFFLCKLVVAFVTFLATAFFYREKPPSPPTVIDNKEDLHFIESLKELVKDKYFMLMAQAYGIYFGLFVAVSVILSQIVTWEYGGDPGVQHAIGWMGFTCDVTAIISCLLIGLYLDRYPHHQGVAIFLNAGSLVLWLGFIFVLTKSESFVGLFVIYSTYGIVGVPYFASGVEQAAEMTSPVPEGTSSAVILLLGNLYGFLLIFILGALLEDNYPKTVLYIILGLYLLSTIFACVAKTEMKRSDAESASTLSISIMDDSRSQSPFGYGSEHETDMDKWINVVVLKDEK